MKHSKIFCIEVSLMEDKEYLELEKAMEYGEQLESLSAFGNILDQVVDDISKKRVEDDVEALSESIGYQKAVYENAMLLYKHIQAEDMGEVNSGKLLDDFYKSVQNYYVFSKGATPNTKVDN